MLGNGRVVLKVAFFKAYTSIQINLALVGQGEQVGAGNALKVLAMGKRSLLRCDQVRPLSRSVMLTPTRPPVVASIEVTVSVRALPNSGVVAARVPIGVISRLVARMSATLVFMGITFCYCGQ